MLTEPKRIKVNPDSEMARILDEAKESPVILESNGEIFRLYHEKGNGVVEFGPERMRRAIADAAGSWADLDTDKMIDEPYRAREQGSRTQQYQFGPQCCSVRYQVCYL